MVPVAGLVPYYNTFTVIVKEEAKPFSVFCNAKLVYHIGSIGF